jgi:predicted transcriptional regulator
MPHQPKTRITIRLDDDLLERFKREAAATAQSENPAGYQTLICEALREYCGYRDAMNALVTQSPAHLRWMEQKRQRDAAQGKLRPA